MIFNTWKTSTKEVPINEMDKLFVLKAAKQCIRKMQYYTYKSEHLAKLRKEKSYLYSLCTNDIKLYYNKTKAFAHLLEKLDQRAVDLGFEIPQDIDDVTAMITVEKETPTISINQLEESL